MISIVIPFKDGKYIGAVLSSILEQDYSDVTFIMVSDAASAPAVLVVKEFLKGHKYLICETGGFDKDLSVLAMNIGLYYADTDKVMFLNERSILSPFFLKQASALFDFDYLGWQIAYTTVEYSGDEAHLVNVSTCPFEDTNLYRPVFIVDRKMAMDKGGFPYKDSAPASLYAFQQQFLNHENSFISNLESSILVDNTYRPSLVAVPDGKKKTFNKDIVDMWNADKWKNFLMERNV